MPDEDGMFDHLHPDPAHWQRQLQRQRANHWSGEDAARLEPIISHSRDDKLAMLEDVVAEMSSRS